MKTRIVAFTIIALFTFFGCDTPSVTPLVKNEISISRSSITLGALTLSTDTFSISSNTEWEVISGASWLEVTKQAGRGDTILSVSTAEVNSYNIDRSAKLFIRSKNDSIFKIITIIQEGSYVPRFLAGSGKIGFLDGTGESAEFNSLRGITVDSRGHVYVADQNNQRIRSIELSSLATTSTLAGNGTLGNIDGSMATATLYNPYDLAVDEMGNIYFTSSSNTVRKIAKDGSVSTFSKGDSFGGFDGATGIAYSIGDFYVADFGNNRIQKISMSGQVTTLAGSGKAGFTDGNSINAEFNSPNGLAVGPNGDIYVAEGKNFAIRKISRDGIVSTIAGNGSMGFVDGYSKQAKFESLLDIAVNNKNQIFVVDGYRIRKIDKDGSVRTIGINGRNTIESASISAISCYGDTLFVTLSSGKVYILNK